jgi:hypothetical protein
MRTRKEIEKDAREALGWRMTDLILEVLLDIRDQQTEYPWPCRYAKSALYLDTEGSPQATCFHVRRQAA